MTHRLSQLLALAAILAPGTARAIPAFARKYDTSCHQCHDRVYPELNAFGRQFKENGYQYPSGGELAYQERSTLHPGIILERIGLWRELPLAVRAQGSVQIPIDYGASKRNSVDFHLLDNLYLMGGGALYRNISVFFSMSLAPSPGLHHAEIGFHNLFFGEGHLNLRLGELLLFDFVRPEHRTITKIGDLAGTTRVGLNPSMLDTSHMGFDVYGRLFRRHLFYELAVVQGAQGTDGISDIDSYKDVFGQLQAHFLDRQWIGAFGYYGKTQITDNSKQVSVRFTDPFFVVGGATEAHVGPVSLHGYVLYGRHENPDGKHATADYIGTRAEVIASIMRTWMALVRFDGVFSDTHALEQRFVSVYTAYSILTNFRVAAELDMNVSHFDQSTAYLMFDLAM